MERKVDNRRYLIPGAIAATLFFFLTLTYFFPPVFALNDDVQLREILSGGYTGTPDWHTVYMRAPLSFLLSTLYRFCSSIPWFGLFYCGCMIIGFLAVLLSFLFRIREEGGKRNDLFRAIFLLWIVILFVIPGYIRPHYTTLAAFCGGVGVCFLLCGKNEEYRRKETASAVFFLLLCDQIRSQVFFLLCPFLILAMLCRIMAAVRMKRNREDRERIGRIVRGIFAFAFLYLLLFGADALAYRSEEWQAYRKLNAARTRLYDYTGVWETDTAKEYYAAIGVDEAAFPVYVHYDLLADPSADEKRLDAMASYEEPTRAVTKLQHLKNILYELRVRTLKPSGEDAGYSLPFLILCLITMITAGRRIFRARGSEAEKRALVWAEGLLPAVTFGVHYLLYGYLLWRGRVPERITVSLYTIAIFFFFGEWMSARNDRDEKKAGKIRVCCTAAVLLAAVLLFGIRQWGRIREAYSEQIAVNIDDDVVYSYLVSHKEEIFLLETYAAVYHTESILESRPYDAENLLLMGGWQYGSPLQRQKLRDLGYGNAEDLFLKGNAYFIRREDRGLSAEELQVFLQETYGGESVFVEPYAILQNGDARFEIYRILSFGSSGADGC